jgi:hypothetical protein
MVLKNKKQGSSSWREEVQLMKEKVQLREKELPERKNQLPVKIGINQFLSNILPDIEKELSKPSTIGTKRSYPKTPKSVERWRDFLTDAARYEYPTTPIGADVVFPTITEIKFKLERDIDKVIANHLDNFNRIFRDQGKKYRFESTVTVFPCTESCQLHWGSRLCSYS